jgi:hypothetical protein
MFDTRIARHILAVGIIVGAIAGMLFVSRPANAVALPNLQLVSQMPAAFQTFESFEVTCADTATAIAPASGLNFTSVYCENNSATSVFIGGSGVLTTTAPCISTTAATCLRSTFSADVARGKAYCLVASGTQAIKCHGAS